MQRNRRRDNKNKRFYLCICAVSIFVALALGIAIALLIWQLVTLGYGNSTNNQTNFTCPPNPCPSTTTSPISTISAQSSSIVNSISSTSMYTSHTSTSITSSPTTQPNTIKKRTYRESCDQLFDCYIEYGLLCEYGWNQTKICLCEGSHYWSVQQNKCLRKGEINALCEIDYQCHREIGLVCDKPPGVPMKICICAASIYWAKDSNCGKSCLFSFCLYPSDAHSEGQTSIRRIVDCIDENYATTCFALGANDIYHMITIRSLTEKELSFDWFLVDNRDLFELPQLSCTFNNDTKYCFGLSTVDIQHSLKLAQFTHKGFHSIENIGGNNRGTAFGLTEINDVSVYVRNSQNTLYRHMIVDDEILSADDIALSLTGDPICYIHEVMATRRLYCFARNSANGLTEYAESATHIWRATQLGNPNDRIRDETAPVCSYVGRVHRYCFAIFANGQIYRILFNSGAWGTWRLTGGEGQFLIQPVFLTSKPLNQSSADQTCYLIAIDTNNHLQFSSNSNCAQTDNFSQWISMASDLKFKQIDKTFRLRDGYIGVLGLDDQNRAYYLFLDPNTNQFAPPRPAFTVKPEQFRP